MDNFQEVLFMSEQQTTGVYQLDNGYWGYRFVNTINGKKKAQKRVKDEFGNPYLERPAG